MMRNVSTPAGGRLQMGIPRDALPGQKIAYLVRGVVVATYVPDDPNYPFSADGCTDVYCDVLAYTNLPGGRFYIIPEVLVTQEGAGLQRGHVYRPRAAKNFLNGAPIPAGITTSPSQMDGDHVLVGFIDGDRHAPVVLRFLPHPQKDSGNPGALPIGQRLGMRLVDGDPSLFKHHGTFHGVTDSGDFVVDTTRANDGTLLPGGAEPAAGVTGSGNNLARVGASASAQRSVVDATVPGSPVELLRETLSKAGYTLDMKALDAFFQVLNATGNTLTVQHGGNQTTMTVGSGAQSVAVAENLQSFWNNTVVPYIQAMVFATPLGPTAVGPVTPPPSFDATIISGKIKIPSN